MIRAAIAGYGGIGKSVERAINNSGDMELAAIFTRRPNDAANATAPLISMDEAAAWAERVDVLILCGGSFADLPVQGPELAKHFHTVDSFDTHPDIPQYFATMDKALKASGKLGLISAGWDPGLFSLNRLYMSAALPDGESCTFWGRGISQGHSNAIRQIEGVADAVQYTCPIKNAVQKVRSGAMPRLTPREKHERECYVVLKEGADAAYVEKEIINMPYYFADNNTRVHFISREELAENHSCTATEGFVFRSGRTGNGNVHHMDYSLKLDSNPEFTAQVMVACARAVSKMAAEGKTGAITVLDVPPALLSAKSGEQLRLELL